MHALIYTRTDAWILSKLSFLRPSSFRQIIRLLYRVNQFLYFTCLAEASENCMSFIVSILRKMLMNSNHFFAELRGLSRCWLLNTQLSWSTQERRQNQRILPNIWPNQRPFHYRLLWHGVRTRVCLDLNWIICAEKQSSAASANTSPANKCTSERRNTKLEHLQNVVITDDVFEIPVHSLESNMQSPC